MACYGSCMKQTLMLRLDPSPGQRGALIATMEAFNRAASEIAAWASEHETSSRWAIQAGCYYAIRERHGLSAQMTVRAIKVAADAQHRLPKGKAATFKPRGAVVYDSRIMSFKGAENVSLWTLTGRQLVPIRMGDYQRGRMDRQRGEADLILRDGVFYLAVCLDAPEPSPADPVGTLGVDLGIVNLAADSDGNTHSGVESRQHFRIARRGLTAHQTNLLVELADAANQRRQASLDAPQPRKLHVWRVASNPLDHAVLDVVRTGLEESGKCREVLRSDVAVSREPPLHLPLGHADRLADLLERVARKLL